MLQETCLIASHRECGGKVVDFGGWAMPVNYGSQVDEHHSVRKQAGMFDVSHMTIVDVSGAEAKLYLQTLLANDVAKLPYVGKALYSAMLNEQGGVIDDLIVYLQPNGYRLVVNCATREKDLAWMQELSKRFDVLIQERDDLAMIAVQGPKARRIVNTYLECPDELNGLEVFSAASIEWQGDEWFIGRTGYTGEDGYEIIIPASLAEKTWADFKDAGIAPCGLGARDTLRLEAGMNLYGHEMDETVSPLSANMAWTIDLKNKDRQFVGRKKIAEQKLAGGLQLLVGLILEGRGVLREGYPVFFCEKNIGTITSGTFSPTLEKSIALARIDMTGIDSQSDLAVEIRGKRYDVRLVKPAFVRAGESVVQPYF